MNSCIRSARSCIQQRYLSTNYWDAMYQREIAASRKASLLHGLKAYAKNSDQKPHMSSIWEASRIDRPDSLKRLTAEAAASLRALPGNSRISTRDFIHNSLYHPLYGYFSRHAHIFSLPSPILFPTIKDSYEFMNRLGQLYKDMESAQPSTSNSVQRQVWHTPTELFRPYYGEAIAAYVVKRHKAEGASHPLLIYEIGGGNGTLMNNVLDYVQNNHPEIYASMCYHLIEISPMLYDVQRGKESSISRHGDRVRIVNKSIFSWKERIDSPCFFVASEVIDNFAHDLVRYDAETTSPLQGMVLISEDGDFEEAYEAVNDPLLLQYMDLRNQTGYTSPVLRKSLLAQINPLRSNLTGAEFVPTMMMQLISLLSTYFPNHRLVISDFDKLPDSVDAVDGPVVQTRYDGGMVACSTYLVQPGYFDIFFPTNFELLKDMYMRMTNREAAVMSQRQFLKENANLSLTTTKSGENPMLSFYENFKFILS